MVGSSLVAIVHQDRRGGMWRVVSHITSILRMSSQTLDLGRMDGVGGAHPHTAAAIGVEMGYTLLD
jgi:hypothetical protein